MGSVAEAQLAIEQLNNRPPEVAGPTLVVRYAANRFRETNSPLQPNGDQLHAQQHQQGQQLYGQLGDGGSCGTCAHGGGYGSACGCLCGGAGQSAAAPSIGSGMPCVGGLCSGGVCGADGGYGGQCGYTMQDSSSCGGTMPTFAFGDGYIGGGSAASGPHGCMGTGGCGHAQNHPFGEATGFVDSGVHLSAQEVVHRQGGYSCEPPISAAVPAALSLGGRFAVSGFGGGAEQHSSIAHCDFEAGLASGPNRGQDIPCGALLQQLPRESDTSPSQHVRGISQQSPLQDVGREGPSLQGHCGATSQQFDFEGQIVPEDFATGGPLVTGTPEYRASPEFGASHEPSGPLLVADTDAFEDGYLVDGDSSPHGLLPEQVLEAS